MPMQNRRLPRRKRGAMGRDRVAGAARRYATGPRRRSLVGYLRRSLSAANATTPLSTPSAVTTLPASISGTASTHAYALLANRSTAQPIRAQWNFFMPISSRASDLTEKLLAAKPLGSQCDHAAEYPKRSYRA